MEIISKNYVFVHGAWHGSWCFDRYVTKKMTEDSNVFTLDLPGHYSNNNFNFKDITLDKYVDYVSNFIQNNIKGEVILIGHSMGGIVISQVAENIPLHISDLVYLCAFIPSSNSSLLDEEKKTNHPSVSVNITIDEKKCLISLNQDIVEDLFYKNCSIDDVEFAKKHLQNQPLIPFTSNVSVGSNFDSIKKTYIECLQDKAIHIEDQKRMNIICDKIYSINTDHSPFFSAPDKLVEILKKI